MNLDDGAEALPQGCQDHTKLCRHTCAQLRMLLCMRPSHVSEQLRNVLKVNCRYQSQFQLLSA